MGAALPRGLLVRSAPDWHRETARPLRIVRQRRSGGWWRAIDGNALASHSFVALLCLGIMVLGARLGWDLVWLVVEVTK